MELSRIVVAWLVLGTSGAVGQSVHSGNAADDSGTMSVLRLNAQQSVGSGGNGKMSGADQWDLVTDKGANLSVRSFMPESTPLTFQSSDQTIRANWQAILTTSFAPSDGGAVGPVLSAHNTGSNGALGSLFQYFSSADAPHFDTGRESVSSFNPKSWRPCSISDTQSCSGPGDLGEWMLTLSPNDAIHGWGTNVAEWNIVNRGRDMGFQRDRGQQQTTGGLLLVPETSVFGDPGGGEGKNAGFGYSVARSVAANSTGFSAKFYIGYNCEPDSQVGQFGRCLYATGDTTGTGSQVPYGPFQIDGSWLHGVDTTVAIFKDELAVRMAAGHRLGWIDGVATAFIGSSGSGKKLSIVLKPAENGSVMMAGHLGNSSVPLRSTNLLDCGASPSIAGNDRHGTVTPGTNAKTCTINFETNYDIAPDVQLTGWSVDTLPFISTVSKRSLIVGFRTAGKFSYLVEQ